jgi:hypothetical protein
VIGYNVSEMINEWGAYAGVLPQTGFCMIVGYRFRAGINLKGKLKPKGVSHQVVNLCIK